MILEFGLKAATERLRKQVETPAGHSIMKGYSFAVMSTDDVCEVLNECDRLRAEVERLRRSCGER